MIGIEPTSSHSQYDILALLNYKSITKVVGIEPTMLILETRVLPIKLYLSITWCGNWTHVNGLKVRCIATMLTRLFTPAPTSVSTTLLRLSTHCSYLYLYQLKTRLIKNIFFNSFLFFLQDLIPVNSININSKRLTGSLYTNLNNFHRFVMINDYQAIPTLCN